MVDRAIERLRVWPVMLLATFRPEFEPPWIGQPHVTMLTLSRLERHDTAMVANIAGNRALPEDVVQEIADRTDGVPLFVEELTNAILESGSRATLSALPHASAAVPATLHASLMARLDRLGPVAKNVAQAGAAIGREFSYELLSASIGGFDEPMLNEALQRLVAAGLVFQRGTPPAAEYLFKHALIQDTAYGTLLRDARRDMHRRIAEALETQFVGLIETRPEIAAHHFGEALQADKAVDYWLRAGRMSVTRSAVREAETQLRRGLDLLGTLPENRERKLRELDFLVTLTAALMGARGYADPEVAALLDRSRQLVTDTGQVGSPLHFSVLWGIWASAYVGGNAKRILELAGEFHSLAEAQPASGPRLIGHRILGASLMVLGNYREALPHLTHAASLYRPDKHRELAFRYRQDIGASALCYLAWALWHNGYPEQATLTADRALGQAREFGHAHTLAYVYWFAAKLAVSERDAVHVTALASEALAISADHGFSLWLANSDVFLGWAAAQRGEAVAGVARMRAGIAAVTAIGARNAGPFFLGLLGEGLVLDGKAAEALERLDDAAAEATRTGEVADVAELWRLRGVALRSLGSANDDEAGSMFAQAIDEARRQGSRLYELRAATSLALLWRDRGRSREAYDLLAPLYAWFTEGFGTRDLKEAKVLLDELADQARAAGDWN